MQTTPTTTSRIRRPPVPRDPVASHLTYLHALAAAFVARGQDLRTLHKQCRALLQDAKMSPEQRREQLQQVLRAEQDVLAESLLLQPQMC